MVFFSFPEDARWNDEQGAVAFTVVLGEYQGERPSAVFQRLLDQSPTPERCLEAFHLQRTRFEIAVERKLRRRQLTDDGNVEITGRDLRERETALINRNSSNAARPFGLYLPSFSRARAYIIRSSKPGTMVSDLNSAR